VTFSLLTSSSLLFVTSVQDDESLKHLTHEEKDVILFFEETLDSLEYDFDEPTLCDSGIHCHSPQSLEESPSSHSEPEDVIDLVQPAPASGEAESLPDVPPVAGEQHTRVPTPLTWFGGTSCSSLPVLVGTDTHKASQLLEGSLSSKGTVKGEGETGRERTRGREKEKKDQMSI